jgi:FtsZ-binding cell division protein ZapB
MRRNESYCTKLMKKKGKFKRNIIFSVLLLVGAGTTSSFAYAAENPQAVNELINKNPIIADYLKELQSTINSLKDENNSLKETVQQQQDEINQLKSTIGKQQQTIEELPNSFWMNPPKFTKGMPIEQVNELIGREPDGVWDNGNGKSYWYSSLSNAYSGIELTVNTDYNGNVKQFFYKYYNYFQ